MDIYEVFSLLFLGGSFLLAALWKAIHNAATITFVSIRVFIYFAPSLSLFLPSTSVSIGRIPNKDFAVSTLSILAVDFHPPFSKKNRNRSQ